MFKKKLKWIIPVVAVLILAAGGFIWYRTTITQRSTAAKSTYQTSRLETGSLTATISATGNVRTNQSANINWQTSGKVSTITVHTGESVKADQVLAALDPTSLSQNMIQAQADLATAQTNLENLKKPTALAIAQAEAAITAAQTDLDNLSATNALAVAKATSDLQTAKDSLITAQYNRSYLDYRIGSQQAIDSAKATIALLTYNIERDGGLKWKFNKVADRQPDDPQRAQALSNLTTAQTNLATAQRNLAYLEGNGTEKDIADADAAVQLAQANVADAQRKLDELKKGVKPSDLALAQAKVQDAKDNLAELMNPTAADIAAAQAKVDGIQALINQQGLKAPFAGTITDINVMKGDLVSNGTNAFRIDDQSAIYVDLQVSEIDINNIQVGQTASLTFDAIPSKTYNGTVYEVGNIGTTSSGVVNFTVTVKLTDADALVKTGMTVAANIVTSQIDNVLLVPSRAIRTTNNRSTIYIMTAAGLQPVLIQIGSSNDTQTQITAGNVKAGDRVVLNPPTTTFAQAGGFGFMGGIFGGGGGGGVRVQSGQGGQGGTQGNQSGGTRQNTTGGIPGD
jgi:HlyD family secretion protein